jgi:hypothetical protein
MYDPTRWEDFVRDPADEFFVVKIGDTLYRITPAGTVMEEGTPQDQAHFNKMEDGILDAHIAVAILFNAFRQYKDGEDERTHTYTGATLLDMDAVVRLVMNLARQNKWEIESIQKWMADHDITESGTITLTNTQKIPFNNSRQSVSLSKVRKTTNYVVLTEVTAFNGNVGEVEVTGKLTNGFQIGYTGSAASATIKYVVIGGFGES